MNNPCAHNKQNVTTCYDMMFNQCEPAAAAMQGGFDLEV